MIRIKSLKLQIKILQILQWPLIISSLATTVSILWRLVMLYFAYRGMIFPLKPISRPNTITPQPTIYEQFKLNLSQKYFVYQISLLNK